MARLTNAKRDLIIETETKLKFHDAETQLTKEYKDELLTIAKKDVPKCITKEVMGSGYIDYSRYATTPDTPIPSVVSRNCNDDLQEMYSGVPSKDGYIIELKSTMKLRKTLVKLENHFEKRRQYTTELRQVLYAYSNVKKLCEALPEIKNHFSSELNANALVPVDQIKRVRDGLVKPR